MTGPGIEASDPVRERGASGPDVLRDAGVGARVVRGGIARAGGFVFVNLITALAAVLLLRHLGVADYGRYGTVMSLLAIVQGISDGGLQLTGSRELAVANTDEARRHMLSHLIGLRVILGAIGIALAVAFAAAVGYPRTMVEGTALAGLGIFFLSVQSAMLLPLSVSLSNGRLALNDVIRQVVLVAGFVILVIVGQSLITFFEAQLVAGLVTLLATPLLLARRDLVRPRWTRADLRVLTRATLPLAVSTALIAMYFRVLVVLISVLESSPREIGFYVTAERIIELCLNLPVMLVAVALPVLTVSARDDSARLRYVTLRMTQMMAVIGVLLVVIFVTGARPIIIALGGHQYAPAAIVLQIQSIALVTVFITSSWTTTLVGMGHARQLAWCTGIGVVAVIVIGVALILPFGAKGAASAAIAADIVFCSSVYVALRRTGATGAMRPGPLLRIAGAALPAFALDAVSPLPAVANCVLATLLYLVLLLVTGALPSELLDLLPAPLSRRR